MESLFSTLGHILRPENSQPKQEFLIWERLAECTREYRQHPDGIIAYTIVEARSADRALADWLLEKSEAYNISPAESGNWQEDCSGRIVYEAGDTSADFGDFTVHATDVEDIEPGSHLEQAGIKAHLIQEAE